MCYKNGKQLNYMKEKRKSQKNRTVWKVFKKWKGVHLKIGPVVAKFFSALRIIQGDQKVSAHLMVTIQPSGAQILFDHPVLYSCTPSCHSYLHISATRNIASGVLSEFFI
jgi:hypothetical protein